MLRSSWKRVALAAVALAMAVALPAAAQATRDGFSLGANYVADRSNAYPGTCGCFTLQGGGVTATLDLPYRLAAVADFTMVHASTVPGSNYGLGLATYMAGAQYRYPVHQVTPYGQALIGTVHGFDSVFPGSSSTTANSFAFEIGAGTEYRIDRSFSVRILELDYLRTNLPNNTSSSWQNHLKFVSGVIYHF